MYIRGGAGGDGLKFEDKVSDTGSKGKKTGASSLVSGKWSYPPRESTSLRWRASRRNAAERFVSRALKDIFYTHAHEEEHHFALPFSPSPSIFVVVFIESFLR